MGKCRDAGFKDQVLEATPRGTKRDETDLISVCARQDAASEKGTYTGSSIRNTNGLSQGDNQTLFSRVDKDPELDNSCPFNTNQSPLGRGNLV